MQTKKALRSGSVTLCLLAMLVVSGCGQKGPLYREAPAAVGVSEAASGRAEAGSDGRDSDHAAR
ncbi:LPS translocon maturation chaperone LptM [Marinobacter sp.]|uniref:LPS translocon maturation chaperone LptM n=1 Tax=Marinobacter sp. TaxID=50741 RepID=UPI002B27B0FA|nr:lipoprotein [Marinobacter sp.]